MSEPKQGFRSCSQQSLDVAEPLLGSAGSSEYFAAVSWPKPLWDPGTAALSEGLPEELSALEKAQKAGGSQLALRVFQREPGTSREGVELLCIRPGDSRSMRRTEIPIGSVARELESFLSGEARGAEVATPQILVCTDGQHDRCCAAHGRAFFEALREVVESSGAAIGLAESSHLGGHRLAATCIVLPAGRMYGRLRPEDAPALIEAVQLDRVWLPRYRGRMGLTELEQISEAETCARNPNERPVQAQISGDSAMIELDTDGQRLCVEYRRQAFVSAAGCANAPTETRMRWAHVRTVRTSGRTPGRA
ncbi:MAG: hypothetical protein GY725_21175 [bacterium]|nr:hypothetical protein [bacterium]